MAAWWRRRRGGVPTRERATSPGLEQRDDRGRDLRAQARPRVEEFHELGVLGHTLADLRTKTLVRAGTEARPRR